MPADPPPLADSPPLAERTMREAVPAPVAPGPAGSAGPWHPNPRGARIGGIVVAGGAGRRMGGPKASLELGGRRLVDIALAALAPWCSPLVVVTRPAVPVEPAGDRAAAAPAGPGLAPGPWRVVFDRPGWEGPLGALVTGLAALSTPQAIVLACDLPFAAPAIAALAAAHLPGGTGRGRALVAVDRDGRPQGLCARYDRAGALVAGERLLDAGVRRLGALFEELETATLSFSGHELANLNEPADLAWAARRAERARSGNPEGRG